MNNIINLADAMRLHPSALAGVRPLVDPQVIDDPRPSPLLAPRKSTPPQGTGVHAGPSDVVVSPPVARTGISPSRRQVEAVTAVADDLTRKVAGRIVSLVEMAGDQGLSKSQIRVGLSRPQRDAFQDGLFQAIERGEIELHSEAGQGEDKHRYLPKAVQR